jgi:hypothetical protein
LNQPGKKKSNKITEISKYLSIITLNLNDLNWPFNLQLKDGDWLTGLKNKIQLLFFARATPPWQRCT